MPPEESAADRLVQLDARIDEAASDGDFASIDPLLADDFVYTHSTGHAQSKGEWLESLKPLVGRRRRVVSGARAELHDDVAVVAGDVDIVWTDGNRKLNRYVRVFRRRGDSWQAISQRTVPAPDRTT